MSNKFSLLALSLLVGLSGGARASEITAAVTPSSPPMVFEQDGKIVGIDVELFEGFCKSRGHTLKIAPYDWQGMLGAVSSGQADAAFSGISITEKRKKVMDFSQPYYDNAWHLVALQKRGIKVPALDVVKQYSIGYPRGMAYNDLIKNEWEPKGFYSIKDAKLYPTYGEVVTDLQNGKLDLAFIEEPVFADYKNKKQLPIESVYVISGQDQLGFAFKKDSPLRSEFDQYLKALGPEAIKAIIQKWMK